MQKITEEFFREGSVVIPNMISKEEVTAFVLWLIHMQPVSNPIANTFPIMATPLS
jgi:hypothetical protein